MTNREDDLVKQVALRCNESYDADARNGLAQVQQLRQQYPPEAGKPRPAGVDQQLAALQQRREDLVQGCLLDLKNGMGDMRFQMLRDWVMRNIAPDIKHGDANPVAQVAAPSRNVPAPRTLPNTAPNGQAVTINDPRPLAKAAEILQARYGVPISYEDVSTYAYSADLEEPNEFRRNNPNAKSLPPKRRMLSFTAPTLQISYYPVQPADKESVSSLLQSVIDQHHANGNAGQFRIIETPVGLTIVPAMARDSLGNFKADQSLLDLRISLLDYDERRGVSLYQAFAQALSAACGRPVVVDGLWAPEAKIQATNEVARDVLVKILMALGPSPMGVSSSDGKRSPPPVIAWSLITEPGIDTSHPTAYHLHFRNVVMEKYDSKGNIVNRGFVTRRSVAPDRQ